MAAMEDVIFYAGNRISADFMIHLLPIIWLIKYEV